MNNCIFCKIINGDIPADIVYENNSIIAFNDINPQAPTHVLIIPKIHIATLDDVKDFSMYASIFEAISEIVKIKKLDKGYRVVANCKEHGGQEVEHIHFHLLGERSMKWPPG